MSQPIRIIYLIGQLGLGGSERQLYLLLKHMDKTRFEPHVVVFNPSANYTLNDDLRNAGVHVHAIPLDVKGIRARMQWLYQLFRKIRPYVIHSWSIHDNPYAGLIGWLARVPRRLGSVRGSLTSEDFLHFHPLIRWLILHSVQGHLVNSDAIAEQMREAGIPTRRIHVLPNCVETDASQPAAQLADIPPDARVVGMVGNLRREKNYPMFVRGMAQVVGEFDRVYGAMVGQPVMASDPDVPNQIRAEVAAQNAAGRVKLIGFRSDVPAVLSRLEIFCLTSDSEGTPNAVLEAMAAGLPVIATRVGGIPRIVDDGVSGFLVERGDVNGFAEALRMLLRDPQRAILMGAAGRTRVESDFGTNTIVRKFEEYYLAQSDK
jgi:glycosyltransferase involved in cell wall biosynthesis